MDIRKKDMTNNITIILTFMMLEPLNWSPLCVKQTSNSGAVITNSLAVITNSPAVKF